MCDLRIRGSAPSPVASSPSLLNVGRRRSSLRRFNTRTSRIIIIGSASKPFTLSQRGQKTFWRLLSCRVADPGKKFTGGRFYEVAIKSKSRVERHQLGGSARIYPRACTLTALPSLRQHIPPIGVGLPLLSTVRGNYLNITFNYASFLLFLSSVASPRLPPVAFVACSLLCPLSSRMSDLDLPQSGEAPSPARTGARGVGGPD